MIRRLFYVLKFKIVMKLRVFGCYLAALYLPVSVSASKLAPQAKQEALELAQDNDAFINAMSQTDTKIADKSKKKPVAQPIVYVTREENIRRASLCKPPREEAPNHDIRRKPIYRD